MLKDFACESVAREGFGPGSGVLYGARDYLGEPGNAGSILLTMLSVFNGQQGG